VPGSDVKHYAPSTPLSIVNSRTLEEVVSQLTSEHERVAVLAMRPPRVANKFMTWINAGRRADVYARELYVNLRALDKSGASEILVEEVPAGEAWDAVRDRLHRAASAENVVTVDPTSRRCARTSGRTSDSHERPVRHQPVAMAAPRWREPRARSSCLKRLRHVPAGAHFRGWVRRTSASSYDVTARRSSSSTARRSASSIVRSRPRFRVLGCITR